MANAVDSTAIYPPRARLHNLAFYLFIPAVNAFLFGWMRAGRTALWPRPLSLLYWVGNIFIFWLLSDLLARLLALLQGRRQMPLWLLLLLSNIAVGFVAQPLVGAWFGVLQPLLPTDVHVTPPQPFSLASWLAATIPGASIWVGVNLLLLHAFRMPRYGYAADQTGRLPEPATSATAIDARTEVAGSTDANLAFMEKVRPQRRGALLALKAEGHYLKVFTTQGEDLVLYQFSRALSEVASLPGGQVHRSWWVARDAVKRMAGTERLVLNNELEVPVSRSYRMVARRDGLLRSAAELR